MASATKPPYTTLTAYDLNTGTIKWQIAPGDDPATVARGGPRGTGGVGARHGIVATSAGIVFLAGGDGKVRAYDEDTGQVLWTGTLPGPSSGIPVSYEAKGRQFIVVADPGMPRRPLPQPTASSAARWRLNGGGPSGSSSAHRNRRRSRMRRAVHRVCLADNELDRTK